MLTREQVLERWPTSQPHIVKWLDEAAPRDRIPDVVVVSCPDSTVQHFAKPRRDEVGTDLPLRSVCGDSGCGYTEFDSVVGICDRCLDRLAPTRAQRLMADVSQRRYWTMNVRWALEGLRNRRFRGDRLCAYSRLAVDGWRTCDRLAGHQGMHRDGYHMLRPRSLIRRLGRLLGVET